MLVALRFTELGVALVVLGEAVALAFGMGLVGGTPGPWATTWNLLLLISDVLFGGVAAYGALASKETDTLVLLATVGLVISHAYRAAEYFFAVTNPFVFNVGLFLINGLKLIGAAAIIALLFKTRR